MFSAARGVVERRPRVGLFRTVRVITVVLLSIAVACESDPTSPAAINKEIEKLKSPLAAERVGAIVKLGSLGEKAAPAIQALLQKLSDGDEATIQRASDDSKSGSVVIVTKTRVNEQAAIALGRIGRPAIDPLLDYVRNGQYPAWAIEALTNIGEPAVDSLIKLYTDESDDRIKSLSIEALGKIDDPRAVESLTAGLKDKSVYVREKAVDALLKAKVKSIAVIDTLIDALKDSSGYVRSKALDALRDKTGAGDDFYFDLNKWRNWLSENKDKFS